MLELHIVRRMETVVHAAGQAQGDVGAPFQRGRPMLAARGCAQQSFQLVRETFGLKHLALRDGAARAHDGIARRGHERGVRVDHPSPGLELTREARMQAVKF